jgi:hypothetical protein
MQRLAVGEHVAFGESIPGWIIVGAQNCDAVVEQRAAGAQQIGEDARVAIDLRFADVLHHPDARDGIERLAGPERVRVWRLYLRAARHGFDAGYTSVYQVLARRPV